MIHEFAIDPDLLASPERLRYYESHLGFDRGRVVAEFPDDWIERVRKVWPSVAGLTRSRMEERLVRLRRDALLASRRAYDHSKGWPQNAVDSHSKQAFRAIITASNPAGLPEIMVDEEVDERSGPFAVERQVTISRTARKIANLVVPLACTSPRLVLVDPYFSPAIGRYASDRTRTVRTPWYHLMDELTSALPDGVEVEYHTLRKTARGGHPLVGNADREEKADWLSKCREMRAHLPSVISFRVVRWQERPGGDILHARYALTHRCGLVVEAGFDANFKWHARHMHVFLMEATLQNEAWRRFGLRECPFDFVDEHTI